MTDLEFAGQIIVARREEVTRLNNALIATIDELEKRAAECRATYVEDFTEQVRLATVAGTYYHAIDVIRANFDKV